MTRANPAIGHRHNESGVGEIGFLVKTAIVDSEFMFYIGVKDIQPPR